MSAELAKLRNALANQSPKTVAHRQRQTLDRHEQLYNPEVYEVKTYYETLTREEQLQFLAAIRERQARR